eukprot:gene8196-24_t
MFNQGNFGGFGGVPEPRSTFDIEKEISLAKPMSGLFLYLYENYTDKDTKNCLKQYKALSKEEKEKYEEEAKKYEKSIIEIQIPEELKKYEFYYCKKCDNYFEVNTGAGDGGGLFGGIKGINTICEQCEAEDIYFDYDQKVQDYIDKQTKFHHGFGLIPQSNVKDFYTHENRNPQQGFMNQQQPIVPVIEFEELSTEEQQKWEIRFQESLTLFDLGLRLQMIQNDVKHYAENFRQHMKLNSEHKERILHDIFYSNLEDENDPKNDSFTSYSCFSFCFGDFFSLPCVSICEKFLSIPFTENNETLSFFEKKKNHYEAPIDKVKLLSKKFDISNSKVSSILNEMRKIYFQNAEEIEGKLDSLILLQEGNDFKFKSNDELGTLLIFIPSVFKGGEFNLIDKNNENFKKDFTCTYENLQPKYIFLTNYEEFSFEKIETGYEVFLKIDLSSKSKIETPLKISHGEEVAKILPLFFLTKKVSTMSYNFFNSLQQQQKELVVLPGVYENPNPINASYLQRNDHIIYSILKESGNLELKLVPISISLEGTTLKGTVSNLETGELYRDVIDPFGLANKSGKLVNKRMQLVEKRKNENSGFGGFGGFSTKSLIVYSGVGVEFKKKKKCWKGKDCGSVKCPENTCSGKGFYKIFNNEHFCQCNHGYTGSDCSTKIPNFSPLPYGENRQDNREYYSKNEIYKIIILYLTFLQFQFLEFK